MTHILFLVININVCIGDNILIDNIHIDIENV